MKPVTTNNGLDRDPSFLPSIEVVVTLLLPGKLELQTIGALGVHIDCWRGNVYWESQLFGGGLELTQPAAW